VIIERRREGESHWLIPECDESIFYPRPPMTYLTNNEQYVLPRCIAADSR